MNSVMLIIKKSSKLLNYQKEANQTFVLARFCYEVVKNVLLVETNRSFCGVKFLKISQIMHRVFCYVKLLGLGIRTFCHNPSKITLPLVVIFSAVTRTRNEKSIARGLTVIGSSESITS